MKTKTIIFNIFKNRLLRNIFISSLLLLIVIPSFLFYQMNNNFEDEITYNIEDDALRVAKHLNNRHLGSSLKFSVEEFHQIADDFSLYKLRYFNSEGIIISSTVKEEIGTKSESEPFFKIVAKGTIYQKTVQKGMNATDGTLIPQDVIEIYIPIMEDMKFIGAFELYYNITAKVKKFKKLQFKIMVIQSLIVALVFLILLFVLYKASETALSRDIKEKELLKQKELAHQASKYKSEFLANMSHELRTPLNAIIGFSKILLENENEKKKKDKLEIINSSSNTLLQLINDILDISKVETGKVELEKIKFDLLALIENVCQVFSFQVEQKNLSFDLKVNPNIPQYILGDPLRIKQIFMNLLSNAIKFTPENNSIAVEVVYKPSNSLLSIIVSDEGIGIDENKIDYVFEKFTQEDSNTTREYGGTGLGLPISKSLANIMGGDITVSSIKGEGSIFTFYFPIEITEYEERLSFKEDEIKIIDSEKKKILLVDDNELNQILFIEIMKDFNMDITVANDGLEALDIYRKKDFDIVFMDDKMPKMDGKTAITKMKEIDKKHPPIIALTANALLSDKEAFFKVGAIDFLSKPIEIELLRKILKKYLS